MSHQPDTVEAVQTIVKQARNLLPKGGGTKPALSTPANEAVLLDLSQLSGIIEYEPNEYTFTAYAGTPLKEIVGSLAQHGQYMPFDPLLVAQGATLGGTVATNLSGSGRYRYGGVRDFILGVQFIDGRGDVVRSGGKVVKNSAGFDLPKFMVGSLGRYGIFTEFSFKVFPEPKNYTTLQLVYSDLDTALQAIYRLATTPFEMDALDLDVTDEASYMVIIRLGGMPDLLVNRANRLIEFLKQETSPLNVEVMEPNLEASLWSMFNSLGWVEVNEHLVKVPLSPKQIPAFEAKFAGANRRYSTGGATAWLAVADLNEADHHLAGLNLAGLVLRGQPDRPYLGARKGLALAQRVKQALDPDHRFLEA